MTTIYETFTAEQILAIDDPYKLFGTLTYKDELRRLQMKWHPDRNNHEKASLVSAHINELGARAENGDWGNALFVNTGKCKMVFTYKKKVETDVGEMLIGRKIVFFNLDPSNEDFYLSGIDSINSIKFPTKMMEQNFARFVPRELRKYTADKGLVLSMYKGPEQICLADLIDAKYNFNSGHVSWIVTGLYNFALFMEQAQHKMFGGLSLDSVFINPKFRSIHILGGWWFSKKLNSEMLGLPNWIIPFIPASVMKAKTASTVVDQIAIRCLALRLLGDKTMVGSSLLLDKNHKELVKFLRSAPRDTLINDYSAWLKVEKNLPIENVTTTFNDLYS